MTALDPGARATLRRLLGEKGRTFAAEAGIRLGADRPSSLFRLLCASLLYGSRISHDVATNAARALAEAGWTTPQKLAAASWAERTRVLNRSGYARYDESTSRMLGATAEVLLERYRGDLRRLRREAGRDPSRERALLKELKGVGDVTVDIYFREVQSAWPELAPFADRRALAAARRLGLGSTPEELDRLVPRRDLPRLVAALVRDDLDRPGPRSRGRSPKRGPGAG